MLVEALLVGLLGGGGRDRHVAGLLVPLGLHRRARQIVHELGDALVLFLRTALQHPQRGTADDRILRLGCHLRRVGHHAGADLVLAQRLFGAGRRTGRADAEGAFAAVEQRIRLALAAAVHERLVLGPVGHHLDQLDPRLVVELELDVGAAEAVGLGRVGQVVPGAVILDQRPGLPLRSESALGAGGDGLLGHLAQLLPGRRALLGIEAGLGQQLLVPVQHRCRRVERHRQELAVRRRVVAVDRADESLGIERLVGIGHQLVDRIDRAFGGHHVGGADFEDLHDGRCLLGAEGRDRRGQRLGIGALVDRHDLVFALRLVEAGSDLVDRFTQVAAHGVPPLNLGLRGRDRRARQNGDSRDGRQNNP